MLRRAVYTPPRSFSAAELPVPDGRLRLALLTPCLMRGGAERWLLDLLRATDASRLQWIGVGVTNPAHQWPERVREVEATCPVWAGPRGCAELSAAAEAVVTWGIPEWWELVPELLWPRTAVVCQGTGQWSVATMAGCERGRAVVVSQDALQALPEGASAAVIYNGVSVERLKPRQAREELRRAWGVPQEAPILGFLGRLSREKRPGALVEALPRLPGWYGVACGAGPEGPAMRRQAAKLTIADRLRLPGHTEDVGGFLGAVDTLLVPSYEEGYCYSGVEAWLCGVPTVWTPTGMAWERPDLVRGIPLEAAGEKIAGAVLCDGRFPTGTAWRVYEAQEFAARELTMERFGKAWTEFLIRS